MGKSRQKDNDVEWYRYYLIGAIRKIARWSKQRNEVKKAAQVGEKFKCANCSKLVNKYHFDHISPCIPLSGWISWDSYIISTLTGKLQLLCLKCHKAKTKQENEERRRIKNANKT